MDLTAIFEPIEKLGRLINGLTAYGQADIIAHSYFFAVWHVGEHDGTTFDIKTSVHDEPLRPILIGADKVRIARHVPADHKLWFFEDENLCVILDRFSAIYIKVDKIIGVFQI